MFFAWRYGSEEPWRLYNGLDSDYRRLHDPALPAVRPRYPDRLRAFMYGCGKAAAIMEGKMKDAPVTPPARPERRVVLPKGVDAS